MRNTISREQPFQVLATNFSIGPSSSGYELEISADGVNYTSLFTVGANVTRMCTGMANGSYYRLAGNTDEDVVVNWRTQCNDGGEGGGGGTGPQGPQGPQGGVGPQGPQGPAGSGEQLPVECPDVQLLLDICDGEADVAVRLRDAAGNLLGNFSTTNDPYSIYFEGEYAGGLYQVEFEGEWSDENIHFIYDCDGTYESGAYNISKAFDKISIDLIYDEDTGEYNIEFNINYVGGESGDNHVLKSSSGTPENISAGDVYSIHNESGTDAYILDEVEVEKAIVLVSFPNGSDQGDGRWSSAYLNIKIFEWPESAYTATNIEFWGTYYDINVDSLNQSVCIYDRQSEQNAICISVGDSGSITLGTDYQLSIDYSFSDEGDYMDFNINVTDYGEIIWENATNLYDTSTENVTSKLAKGEYNGRLMKWVGAGEWGTWFGMGDGGYNGAADDDQMVTLNYSYLPSGQMKLGDTYWFNNYKSTVVYDSADNAIKVYEDTGLTSLYATVHMGDMDVQANNNFASVYITWIEGIIQFRLNPNTNVRNRVSTAVGDLHYEVAAEDYAHKVIHPYDTADGIPVWNKEGIIIGRRTAYEQRSFYINDTGYSQYAHIVTDGNWYLPERIWVPTTGGTQGQVLTSNGDAAPVWETRIKAVKITSDAYEALAVKDPNTLYLIDDEV